jgi:hypothetical protein
VQARGEKGDTVGVLKGAETVVHTPSGQYPRLQSNEHKPP